MIIKVSKKITVCKELITCRLIEFINGAVFVTHKRMPNSNKHTQLCTESRIKTNKVANRKKIKKELHPTGLEPTPLIVKNTRLSTRLSGNCD